MKVSAPTLVLPAACAFASAWLISLPGWEGLRPAVIPAISMIAAAVLVRLARGLPFTNPDHFSLAQFRDVSSKLEANARYLRALIFVCICAVVAITAAPAAYLKLPPAPAAYAWIGTATELVFSGVIGFLVSYSFVRIFEVVQSDVSLLKLQASLIEGVIARKNAAAFEQEVAGTPPGDIAGASSFGKPLQ